MAGMNSNRIMSDLQSASFYKGLFLGFFLGAVFIYLIVNKIIAISLPGLSG